MGGITGMKGEQKHKSLNRGIQEEREQKNRIAKGTEEQEEHWQNKGSAK
jgi:hypothetical protein